MNWHLCEEHEKDDKLCFDSDFPCNICGKWCRSEEDLARHEQNHATKPAKDHTDEQAKFNRMNFKCKFCDIRFQNKCELMKHTKKDHSTFVSICWKNQTGDCEFGNSSCWFSHEETTNEKFNCKSCDLTFECRPEYLKHRKQRHIEKVPMCKNIIKGECVYGDDNCWFNHQVNRNESDIIEKIEDREILKKLLDMVEKITERVVDIEKNRK